MNQVTTYKGMEDFARLTLDEKRKRAEESRREHKISNTPISLSLPWPKAKVAFVNNIFYGQDFGRYDVATESIVLTRCPAELAQKFETVPGSNGDLTTFALKAREIATAAFEAAEKAATDSVVAAQNWDEKRLKSLEVYEVAMRDIRRDTALQAQPKRQPGAFEKDNINSWKFLSHEDSLQSRDNLQGILLKKRKESSQIDSQITELREGMRPIVDEVVSLKTRLNSDLSEPEFKDVQLSIDYRRNKVDKIESKVTSLKSDKSQMETELAKIQEELQFLNLVIDTHALLNERSNWAKRKERAVERIHRVLTDREGMIQLRINLNAQWKQLTGDKEMLCPELALLADAEIFVI